MLCTPTSTTHPLLHRTAAQLGKYPNAKTRIQNNYDTDTTSVTKTNGDLNPPPMVTGMPATLFTTTTTTNTASLCTFNCVLHKGQVHTIRPGGCCLLAMVQGSKQRYKLKDDLKQWCLLKTINLRITTKNNQQYKHRTDKMIPCPSKLTALLIQLILYGKPHLI